MKTGMPSLACATLLLLPLSCKPPAESTVERVVLAASSQLVAGPGEAVRLGAIAYDASGDRIDDVQLTWHTADASVVTVDDSGMLTGVAIGSTEVVAEVGGVASEPVLVWVATLPDGAVTFDDVQLVSGPDLPEEPLLPGIVYEVVLAGVGRPRVGTVVLAAQDAPVAGRVVQATEGADGTALTLEVVGLTELLVDARIALHDSWDASEAGSRRETTFNLAGFECTLDAETSDPWPEPTLVFSPSSDLTLDRDLEVDLESGVVQHLLLRLSGYARLDVTGQLPFATNFKGTLGCEGVGSTLRFPAPGFLGLLLSVKLPLGVGFEAEASTVSTAAVYEAQGFVRAGIDLGVEFDPIAGLRTFEGFEPTHDLVVRRDTPALDEGMTLQGSFFPYLFAKLRIGPHFSDRDLDLAALKAGVKVDVQYTTAGAQADNPAGASSYRGAIHGELAAGSHLKTFLESVGLSADAVVFEPPADQPLFESPRGETSRSTSDVIAGEPVTLTVEMDPATLQSDEGYNVGAVHFQRYDEESGWAPVAEVPSQSDGQTTFQWEWTPTDDDELDRSVRFAAFVDTVEAPGMLLEVEPDSVQRLKVPYGFEWRGDWYPLDVDLAWPTIGAMACTLDVSVQGWTYAEGSGNHAYAGFYFAGVPPAGQYTVKDWFLGAVTAGETTGYITDYGLNKSYYTTTGGTVEVERGPHGEVVVTWGSLLLRHDVDGSQDLTQGGKLTCLP